MKIFFTLFSLTLLCGASAYAAVDSCEVAVGKAAAYINAGDNADQMDTDVRLILQQGIRLYFDVDVFEAYSESSVPATYRVVAIGNPEDCRVKTVTLKH